ncbi:hypothetical protein J2X69_003830 [Algoriphagus sp. 4150]|nr:hypothetical protein [Algoriphagus sp. 4150]
MNLGEAFGFNTEGGIHQSTQKIAELIPNEWIYLIFAR